MVNASFSLFRSIQSSTVGKHTFQDQTPPASPSLMMAWRSLHVEVRTMPYFPNHTFSSCVHWWCVHQYFQYLGPMLLVNGFRQRNSLSFPECANKRGTPTTKHKKLMRSMHRNTQVFPGMWSCQEVSNAKANRTSLSIFLLCKWKITLRA